MGYRFLYLPNAKVEHKSHGSDIKLAFYVELMTKNLLLSLTKNIPLYHLIKHSPELLYGQIYLVCAYGRPFSSIKGYISFILKMPKAIGKRRMMATEISLNNVEIDALLSKVKPSPAFLILLKIRIMGILGKFRNFRVSR